MTDKELIEYWIKSSDKDYKTMEHLYKGKQYHWALFIGHLVIEKLLKAYYVKMVDKHVPLIHNLTRLAERSELVLTEDQKNFLDLTSTFNIRARYDDYKDEFYKKCTKNFTHKNIENITEFRVWIKEKL